MSADSFELRRLLSPLVPRRFRRGWFADPPFLGYLDRPEWRGGRLRLRGWLVSRGTPIRSLHTRAGGRECLVHFGLERDDIARAFPRVPSAPRSGFAFDAVLPDEGESVEIWATLDSGRRLRAFRARIGRPATPAGAGASFDASRRSMASSTDAGSEWPGLHHALLARQPRVIVELDAKVRRSSVVLAAQHAAPGAWVYVVGEGLGAPDYDPTVCIIDATPADALMYFTDATVDALLVRGALSDRWAAKLRPDALVLHAGIPAPVVFADHDAPTVSIIIPVHGKLELTRRCLQSLAAHKGRTTAEVIVVDDASPDDTRAELRKCRGVRIVPLEVNAGFGNACNQGAAIARGSHLVFLNNDTEVTEGWLDALRQTFLDEQAAGLVGARLVFPDGTLHEAGSLIFRDGSAMNYGRGEDPNHPSYSMLRETDYCSAACAMIPADLFSRLGGFDPHYAPAYYEDADLAFRVRALGYRVLYQPFATIVHHEGGTSGTDVRKGPKRFQAINQEKFRQRWAEVLASYPNRPKDGRTIDPDRLGRQRALVIDHWIPVPDRDAGSLRIDRLLMLLQSAGFVVTFMAEALEYTGKDIERLQRRGIEVLYRPWVPSVRAHLSQQGDRYDLVVLSRRDQAERHLADVRAHAPGATVAYDTVDLHFVREMGAAGVSGDAAALAAADRGREAELGLMRASDAIVVVSEADARFLDREYGITDAIVISTIHEIPPEMPGFADRRDLLFVGYFAHAPNVDGILWFLREVFPDVSRRLPGVRFHVVGAEPPDALRVMASPTVLIRGGVHDLESLLDSARVMVAPLRFGAGVKGKMTQSLSRGLPIVATSVAVEGMEIRDGEEVLVADRPADFADAVQRIYQDQSLWTRVAESGREAARNQYSLDAAKRGMDALVRRVGAVSRDSSDLAPTGHR